MFTADAARDWAITHGLRILCAIAFVVIAQIVLSRAIPPAIRRAMVRDGEDLDRAELLKRAETLAAVIVNSAVVAALVVAIFFVLTEVGFNVAPVIAGLGVGGVALGLGAQTVVKDGINGLFILGENQYARGDMVTVAGVTGYVEEVGLRRTVLRGEDGTMHTIPNSAISVASNHTRGYSRVYFTVGIDYEADLERAMAEINRIGRELAADKDFARLVLEPARALRVEELEDTYASLRIVGPTRPGAQRQVAGELRRRIKEDFDRLGIPYHGSPIAAGGKS
jgi:moderate conductance mechanosensitive channel